MLFRIHERLTNTPLKENDRMTTDKNQRKDEKAQMLECALPVKNTVLTGKSGRKYKILEVLGAGGFGITYKAVSEVKVKEGFSVPTFFAIKEHFMKGCYRGEDHTSVICPSTLESEVGQSREDFRTEAERLMKLNGQSPNIVKVNEWFDANGTRYYVMEYLDGQTLEQYAGGRLLSEAEALSLFLPVARAVELVHKERLLHLDIKPDNIVLKTDFARGATIPVLIDFGLSKHFDSKGKPTSHLVAKGATEGYAPMEQYAEIDHFAPEIDVYALGATLFFLLTGQNPPKAFDIPSVSVLIGKLPADVSPRVRKALEGAMQPSRHSRTQTVAEFVAALESVTGTSKEDSDIPSYETSDSKTVSFKHEKGKAWFKKKPVVIGAACLLALCGRSLYVMVNSDEWKAKHGDASAQFWLGVNYNSEGDMSKAVYWWTKAAEQGDSSSQYELGVCYYYGNGVTQDYETAVAWYTKAAEQGHPSAQNGLGDCYSYGHGVVQNYEMAVIWYVKSAEQGNYDAQNNLGECYYYGRGVTQNYETAVSWYTKAAEHYNLAAQYNLGNCYLIGKGVSKNYEMAVSWYTKAADRGYSPAQEQLGNCYYWGTGVQKNYETAVLWYRKAAEQNHPIAQQELGGCYYRGEGVPQDYKKAVYWYTKAAEQDYSVAQFCLAECYALGRGIPQSDEKAREWWEKAKANGYAPYTLSQIKNGNSGKPIM